MSLAIRVLRFIERMRRPLPIPVSLPGSLRNGTSQDSVQWDLSDTTAQPVMKSLWWNPALFSVMIPSAASDLGYLPIEFSSPIGAEYGNAVLRWFPAQGLPANTDAPACLVLHETGPTMIAAVSFARGLAKQGIHAFLLVSSGYGERSERAPENILDWYRATIQEARRARDVIAALPTVSPTGISLLGISLGGFIASVAAAIDLAFADVFLILCGVDIYAILKSGNADAREWLERLYALGFSDDQIRTECNAIEPANVVHRLDRAQTHLFVGRYDRVVRPEYSDQLASKIGLPHGQYHRLRCSHYSGVIFLPWMVKTIAKQIHRSAEHRR